jgi:DNA-binding response OmpR family regulator
MEPFASWAGWSGEKGNHVDLLRFLHGKRILVVEDDPLIALDLKVTLERASIVVIGPAGRLAVAMLLAEKSVPQAAVLDVRLEVGTSLPLAEWLAERHIPFLFQTSDPTLIDARYSDAPVLRKPFRPEHLVAALAALLAKKR